MAILDLILGPKCADCECRVKGKKYEVPAEPPGVEKQWLCSPCKERRDSAREQLAKAKRDSPPEQLATELPRILGSVESNPDSPQIAALQRLSQRFEEDWRGVEFDWRVKSEAEQLMIRALSCRNEQVRVLLTRLLGVVGFVPSVPKLIAIIGSQDKAAPAARLAIEAHLERLQGGWDTCPRCGSSKTTEGNATGWRCTTCDLEYRPRGARDPISFALGGGFHGGPWQRKDLRNLLEEVTAGAAVASTDKVHEWCERAEQIAAEREKVVALLDKY